MRQMGEEVKMHEQQIGETATALKNMKLELQVKPPFPTMKNSGGDWKGEINK